MKHNPQTLTRNSKSGSDFEDDADPLRVIVEMVSRDLLAEIDSVIAKSSSQSTQSSSEFPRSPPEFSASSLPSFLNLVGSHGAHHLEHFHEYIPLGSSSVVNTSNPKLLSKSKMPTGSVIDDDLDPALLNPMNNALNMHTDAGLLLAAVQPMYHEAALEGGDSFNGLYFKEIVRVRFEG